MGKIISFFNHKGGVGKTTEDWIYYKKSNVGKIH